MGNRIGKASQEDEQQHLSDLTDVSDSKDAEVVVKIRVK